MRLILYIIFMSFVSFSLSTIAYTLKDSKRTYRMIPITYTGIILIIYILGLLNHLSVGITLINISVVALYIIAVFAAVKRRILLNSVKKLLPEFLVFTSFFIILVICNYGMLAHGGDEFSRWADVVKVMFLYDEYSTAPLINASFKSYPPGIAILQYYFTKNYSALCQTDDFAEWPMYLAYHALCMSFLFPLFDRYKKNVLRCACSIIAFLSVCTVYYFNFFYSLYADPVVSIMGASVFCLISFTQEKDTIYDTQVILICACLVITKDIGVYIAIVCAAMYVFDKIFIKSKKMLYNSLLMIFSIVIVNLSWKQELNRKNVPLSFSSDINFAEYIKMLIFRNGTDYKQTVVNNAFSAFFEPRVRIFPIGSFYISYFIVTIIYLAAIIFLSKTSNNQNRKQIILYKTMPITLLLPYVLFIGAVYAYRFSEYEAVRLASYERYMNIVYLIVGIYVTFLISEYIYNSVPFRNSSNVSLVIFVLIIIALGKPHAIYRYVSRYYVGFCKQIRQEYEPLCEKITSSCTSDDKVYYLSRGDNGLGKSLVKYVVRPISISDNSIYSLGAPLNDDDIYSQAISVDEFFNLLIAEECTFVAIHNAGDDFAIQYGELFDDENNISDNSLYIIDKEKLCLHEVVN